MARIIRLISQYNSWAMTL